MATGKITNLVADYGFGFIEPDDGGLPVYFHHTVVQGVKFRQLQPGQPVRLATAPDPKNPTRLRATIVELVAE